VGRRDRVTAWFSEAVEISTHFVEPAEVVREVENAGFLVMANIMRRPSPTIEYPSRRCYLLARRQSNA
jgi:hypothetical protein